MAQGDADIIVIGAGIAGLMAANLLQKGGAHVTVLERSKSVGGRLATRRIGPGRADHGAQFFTVRTPEFRHWVQQWEYEKIVYTWSMGWSDGSLHQGQSDGNPRYAVHGGMNALAKHLARDLDDVQVNSVIVTVTATHDGWLVQNEGGDIYTARGLVVTPPVPQTLELLRGGATTLAPDDQETLEKIEYRPCICGLFWLEGPVHLPEPGAIQRHDAPIAWIADNHRKGISREATILTVHAGIDFSQQLWNETDEDALAALRASFKPYIEPDTHILEAQIKRWSYSIPTTTHPERFLMAANLPPLVFSGDAFGGPRVEGAALSGLAAGRALMERLGQPG
jgi:predicted NAD/FAD-dependent oxidoreductase